MESLGSHYAIKMNEKVRPHWKLWFHCQLKRNETKLWLKDNQNISRFTQ